MNILVFGANGMLGRYVCKRLSQEHNAMGFTRKDLNVFKLDHTLLPFVLKNTVCGYDVVINCAGIIKSRKDVSSVEFVYINSIFPRILADVCKKANIKMFHVSTDCVYDGFGIAPYSEKDQHTATDLYGKTKSLGENEDCCVIRTSIIGEEIGQSRSLIEWAKSEKGRTVKGFINHWWNGVTCLQLAELFSLMLKDNIYWTGVRHVFSPRVVLKYELLTMISEVYDLGLNVEQVLPDVSCFRALTTTNKEWEKYLREHIPSLKEQLVKMKEFKLV